ncbi:MAG: AraC family transcriptional regulator [Cytophagales bacterium]|nr:MAG: AraC family transcriptional regulator [Cytophagales bacterium]
MQLRIKNMVCDRCKRVVRERLEELGIPVLRVELGEVDVAEIPPTVSDEAIQEVLEAEGFALLTDHRRGLVEQIKTLLVSELQAPSARREGETMSAFLVRKMGYDYTYLSHLFSDTEGQTLERYQIRLRLEKAKEWLQDGELTVTEIAFRLGFSSSQHFSNQFRQESGQTPGQFRRDYQQRRQPLDAV